LFKKLIKESWSYMAGAVLLAILNIFLFFLAGKPWQITTAFTYWGAWSWQALGGQPENWTYFIKNVSKKEGLAQGVLTNTLSIMDLGIIIGALLAILLASQFKFKKLKSKKQFIVALLGGIMMGYGSRIALGCNIGAFFSAIPSLSLSGWVFGLFAFLGAGVGSKILMKYLL